MSLLFGYLSETEGCICTDTLSSGAWSGIKQHSTKAIPIPHLGVAIGYRGLSTMLDALIPAMRGMPFETYSFDGVVDYMPRLLGMAFDNLVTVHEAQGDDLGELRGAEVAMMGWSHSARRMACQVWTRGREDAGWKVQEITDHYWATSMLTDGAKKRFRDLPANITPQAALIEMGKALHTYSDAVFGGTGGRIMMIGMSQTRMSCEEIYRWPDAFGLPPGPTDAAIVLPAAPAAPTQIPAATTAGLTRQQRRAIERTQSKRGPR